MMIRRFNPVGQGTFYSEQFDDVTVVYDCGTSTVVSHGKSKPVTIIEKEICHIFKQNQTIDAVFISHLHVDHMNGLEFLLKFCRVTRVYLPLLTPSQKVMHLIDAVNSGNDTQTLFTRQVIGNPNMIKEISNDTQIILVREASLDNFQVEQINRERIRGEVINSGSQVFIPEQKDWVYIPFNFRNIERIQQLNNALEKRGISLDKYGIFTCMPEPQQIIFKELHSSINPTEEIVEYSFDEVWSNRRLRKKITDSYLEIDGDLNANSMTVYSGPIRKAREYVELISNKSFREQKSSKIGCLYLGDYDTKGSEHWTCLYQAYYQYWGSIGICQVPHHGSWHNYNEHLISECESSDYIISAGYNNKFRHPHASVVVNIVRNRRDVHIVTEQVGSAVCFVYPHI